MDEDESVRLHPVAHLLEESSVVPHMFEHFDRHDTVELFFGFKLVDILGDDLEILEPFELSLLFDVLSLGVRVADSRDLGVRVMLCEPERERAPPATEFENGLAVLDLSPLAVECEHLVLRLGQGGIFRLVQAAAVFFSGS